MKKTEEQKKEQSIKAKQQRDLRKAEKREGRTDERRLAWLDELIRSCGFNHKTLAEKAGMTPQALHWIFSVADDCTLSKAESLLNAIDLKLRVKIAPLEGKKANQKTIRKTWQSDDATMEIAGDVNITTPASNYPYPDYIQNYPENGRMSWLVNFIVEKGLSMRSFGMCYGLEPLMVRYWITNDDIRISQLIETATKMNMKIIWQINKI